MLLVRFSKILCESLGLHLMLEESGKRLTDESRRKYTKSINAHRHVSSQIVNALESGHLIVCFHSHKLACI